MAPQECFIIFGSGERALHAIDAIVKIGTDRILSIWDNNKAKWGTFLRNIPIEKPGTVNTGFDKILICSVYYDEICTQLTTKLGIHPDLIVDHRYSLKRTENQIISIYEHDEDKKDIIGHMKNKGLEIFNYSFPGFYKERSYKIVFDVEKQLYYAIWKQKRMYFPASYTNPVKISEYIRNLEIEQDSASPHRYFPGSAICSEEDILLDAGAAEGFFTLELIDTVKHAFLVETDLGWIEALTATFENYKHKVTIIPKYLCDYDDDMHCSIDYLSRTSNFSLIKMDIEGAERASLQGATAALEKAGNMTLFICTYHQSGDDAFIKNILEAAGFKTEYSNGYMFYPYGETIEPELRHGIIRAYKNKKDEEKK